VTFRWLASIGALALVMLAPRSGFPCVCTETEGLGDELTSSDAVFVGRVVGIAIEKVPLEDTTAERMTATFEVERRWKGPKRSRLAVWTCGDQVSLCSCGVEFKLGERYLVFAEGRPLSTGSCNRTRVLAEAEALICELDKLSPSAKGRITTRCS
jgi:hypothetical protein